MSNRNHRQDVIDAIRGPEPEGFPESAGHYRALAILAADLLDTAEKEEAARERDAAHPEFVPEAVTDAAFESQADWWRPGDEPLQGVLVPQLIEQVAEAAYRATIAAGSSSGDADHA